MVERASSRAVAKSLCPKCGSSVASPHQIVVRANLKPAIQNSKLQKLTTLLLNWFAANARDLPWRRTRDPYAIWVSEVMLQQTQVKTVIPYWKRWMRELPTIEAVANTSPDKIHKLWEGLGYYTRARNLQKAAQQIVEQHGGKFPERFDGVLALPGIGRYTAGAICSIAFNQPAPILDGNVIRVLTRIFGIAENPKEKETNARLWKLAEELVVNAAKYRTTRNSRRKETHSKIGKSQSLLTSAATRTQNYSALNQSLMELGALVCTPRNPQCGICPARKLCVAFLENRIAGLPNLGKRVAVTNRRVAAFVVERNGRLLVRQRPAGVVNAHLWEFPNIEIFNGKFDPQRAAKNIFGAKRLGIKPLCTIKHSITRHRITLEAFVVRVKKFQASQSIWRTTGQLQQLAFTGAHRKILDILIQRRA